MFRQHRGTCVGNQISPVLSSLPVIQRKSCWQREWAQLLTSSRFFDTQQAELFICRYVDNRLRSAAWLEPLLSTGSAQHSSIAFCSDWIAVSSYVLQFFCGWRRASTPCPCSPASTCKSGTAAARLRLLVRVARGLEAHRATEGAAVGVPTAIGARTPKSLCTAAAPVPPQRILLLVLFMFLPQFFNTGLPPSPPREPEPPSQGQAMALVAKGQQPVEAMFKDVMIASQLELESQIEALLPGSDPDECVKDGLTLFTQYVYFRLQWYNKYPHRWPIANHECLQSVQARRSFTRKWMRNFSSLQEPEIDRCVRAISAFKV